MKFESNANSMFETEPGYNILHQYLVSSFRISIPWYPVGQRCSEHSIITWAAIWSNAPHSQIDAAAIPHLFMDN